MAQHLPSEPYVPGKTPRPDDACFADIKASVAGCGTIKALANCEAFTFGFEAFEQGYFWEAHEVWEAVWMALPPASAERLFVRGLIQTANARLKRTMGRDRAADRLAKMAESDVSEALRRCGGRCMSLTTVQLQDFMSAQ